MCGRFTLGAKKEAIEQEFAAAVVETEQGEEYRERFNIAPSQIIFAVRQFESARIVSGLKWGLVPSWAKDAEIGNRMINARAESVAEKPSFKNALKSRRCIIPTSGFYEWKRLGDKGKQPFYFYLAGKPVFGFAGLWETWTDKMTGESLESCTIITTAANDVLKPIHDRMPVILRPADYELWLDAKAKDVAELEKLLIPYPAEEMQSHAVSRQVNSPTFDAAELINPLALNSL